MQGVSMVTYVFHLHSVSVSNAIHLRVIHPAQNRIVPTSLRGQQAALKMIRLRHVTQMWSYFTVGL